MAQDDDLSASLRVFYHTSRSPSLMRTIPYLAGRGSVAVESSFHLSHLRPDYVSSDIGPTKTNVVAAVGVCPQAQQFAFDARASEAAFRLLIITIRKVPQNTIASVIDEIRHRIVKMSLIENPIFRVNVVGGF